MKTSYFPHPSSLISLEDRQLLSNVLTPKIYSNFEEKFKDPIGIKFGWIKYYKLSPLRRKQQKLYQDLPTFNPTNNIEENNSLLSWLGDASLNTEIMNYVYKFSLSYYLTSDDLDSICSCLKSNITLAFLARFLGLSTQAGLIGTVYIKFIKYIFFLTITLFFIFPFFRIY